MGRMTLKWIPCTAAATTTIGGSIARLQVSHLVHDLLVKKQRHRHLRSNTDLDSNSQVSREADHSMQRDATERRFALIFESHDFISYCVVSRRASASPTVIALRVW